MSWLQQWRLGEPDACSRDVCLVQIIDAQKARLKRELETLQGSLRKAAAEKERAETEASQLRADLADMSAEQDTIMRRDQQRAQLRQQTHALEAKLQHAACPGAAAGHSQAGKENQRLEVSSGLKILQAPRDWCIHP